MEMTRRQIAAAILAHRRRIRQLQQWYDDSHPLIQWHIRQVALLMERDRRQGVAAVPD